MGNDTHGHDQAFPQPQINEPAPAIVDLKNIKEGDTIHGLVLMDNYAVVPFGNAGKTKIDGTVSTNGVTRKFVVWQGLAYDRLADMQAIGRVAEITASVKTYKDEFQLSITGVTFHHVNVDPSQFQRSVDVTAVREKLSEFLKENVPERTVKLFNDIMQSERLLGSFIKWPAAVKMHDAQIGGLMHHTLKMLRIMRTMIENDPRLEESSELLYLGILFHDAGKIKEIEKGVYTQYSFVTHRIIIVDMLARHKEEIIDVHGEAFYWHLLAIMVGHHGDFEDPCRTVWTKIVHLVDMADSQTTMFMDRKELDNVTVGADGISIWDNGKKLFY